jgi:hypothetical protein
MNWILDHAESILNFLKVIITLQLCRRMSYSLEIDTYEFRCLQPALKRFRKKCIYLYGEKIKQMLWALKASEKINFDLKRGRKEGEREGKKEGKREGGREGGREERREGRERGRKEGRRDGGTEGGNAEDENSMFSCFGLAARAPIHKPFTLPSCQIWVRPTKSAFSDFQLLHIG